MPRVIHTKSFNKNLRRLRKTRTQVAQKILAAMSDANIEGAIKTIPRTKHGETRLPDVEKYDLGDGHRLVVQVVDTKSDTRAFLFAGTHDEAERWLNNHRNYRWVKRESDGKLDFVLVTEPETKPARPLALPNLEAEEASLDLPLLRCLDDAEWEHLDLSEEAREFAGGITSNDWSEDSDGVLERVEGKVTDEGKIALIVDLLAHAHAEEWEQVHRRVEVAKGAVEPVEGEAAAQAMAAPQNSEQFITWDDLDLDLDKQGWEDWMLFLHPEQRKLARRDFKGPSRLRGVSGSGKTCVVVHRARYLAKKYKQPVAVLTLTESMRKLLDALLRRLCGAERSLIQTHTVSGFAKEILEQLHPKGNRWYRSPSQAELDALLRETVKHLQGHENFDKSRLSKLRGHELREFMREELDYVRSRLPQVHLERYADPKAFERRGRRVALRSEARRAVLSAIQFWCAQLTSGKGARLDPVGIVESVCQLLRESTDDKNWFRCVLVDEVQDLSQLEMELLSLLEAPDGEELKSAENGIFLVGDGAQTVYDRGFSLRRVGLQVTGRSYVLKKNYRNSHEILKAAYGLIEGYEFADVDEDSVQRPLEPDFASRRGSRPSLVKCPSIDQEANYTADRIEELLNDDDINPAQICVIGCNTFARQACLNALKRKKISVSVLKDDTAAESDHVKISTIESAKGHEFVAVFILGLVEGVLPRPSADEGREAARLYVAMTRARDRLMMTYTSSIRSKPSSLLTAIQGDCDEVVWDGKEVRPLEV